jgi:hypothetical protein
MSEKVQRVFFGNFVEAVNHPKPIEQARHETKQYPYPENLVIPT